MPLNNITLSTPMFERLCHLAQTHNQTPEVMLQLLMDSFEQKRKDTPAVVASTFPIVHADSVEEELQQQQYLLNQMTNAIPDLLYIYDLDVNRNVYVNHEITAFLGYTAEEIQQIPDLIRYLMHPEDFEKIQERLRWMDTARDHDVIEVEYRMRAADGAWRWLYSRDVILTRHEDSTPHLVLGIAQDITARKDLENDLRTALSKEQELNALKTRFVSMVSHEFRTPLAVIVTSSDLLKRYSARMTESQKQGYLDQIQHQVQTLISLMDTVLTVERSQRMSLKFVPQPINFVDFCHTIIDESRHMLEEKHEMCFNSVGETCAVMADTQLMRLALTNLISNALKYSPNGGCIAVDVIFEQETVLLRVQDHGIGIPEEDLDHIFEMFHRAKNVAGIPGTGLGLHLVAQVVQLHGGSIRIDSTVNAGTTLHLTFPLQRS